MQPRVCLVGKKDRRAAAATGAQSAFAFVQSSTIDVQMIERVPYAGDLKIVIEFDHEIAEYFERLLRRLRSGGDTTLILVLTAKSRQDAKVLGLRGGADDYVTKPFDLEELLARVDVLFRRIRPSDDGAQQGALSDRIAIGEVEVDVPARAIRRSGKDAVVSRIGFDLLLALLRRRGAVVSRAELMREVWGYGEGVVSRTLDTHIFELRQLIEPDPSAPVHIRTVWRIGYRLE